MGKSTTGPDMVDVLQYLHRIEEDTKQRVIVLLESDGYGAGPRWRAHAFTSPHELVNLGESRGVGATLQWPHREYATFEGMLFRLLIQVDVEWARLMYQEKVLR
jgi:hypothetical protein